MSLYLRNIESCMWNPVKWAIEVHGGYSVKNAMSQFGSVYSTDDAFTTAFTLLFGEESLKAVLRRDKLSDKKRKNSNLGIFPSEVCGWADNALLHLSVARRFSTSQVLCSKDLYEAGLIPNKAGKYSTRCSSFMMCLMFRNAIINFFKWNSNNDASKCWQYTTHDESVKTDVVQLLREKKCPYFFVNHNDEVNGKVLHENHYHIYFASVKKSKIEEVVEEISSRYPSKDLHFSLKSIELKEEERNDSRNAFENIANYLTTFVPKRGGFNSRTYYNSHAVDKSIFDRRPVSQKYFGANLLNIVKKESMQLPSQVVEIVHTLLQYAANFDTQLSPSALKFATAVIDHTRKRNKVARFEFFKEALASLVKEDEKLADSALFCARKYTGLQRRFDNVGEHALANAIKRFNHHNYANLDFFRAVDKYSKGKKELEALLNSEALHGIFYRVLSLNNWREDDQSSYHWPYSIVDAYTEAIKSLHSGAPPPSSAR